MLFVEQACVVAVSDISNRACCSYSICFSVYTYVCFLDAIPISKPYVENWCGTGGYSNLKDNILEPVQTDVTALPEFLVPFAIGRQFLGRKESLFIPRHGHLSHR